MQYVTKFLRMLLRRNLADDVAKLRIRKEKDFNITEFLWIRFVFFYEISLAVSSEFVIFALFMG